MWFGSVTSLIFVSSELFPHTWAFFIPPLSGGVLGAGGDSALLSERRRHLPATGRRLQQADSEQHAAHHGPQAEGRLPQEPGGVRGQRGRPAVREITTGARLDLESPLVLKGNQSKTPPASSVELRVEETARTSEEPSACWDPFLTWMFTPFSPGISSRFCPQPPPRLHPLPSSVPQRLLHDWQT